MAEILRRGNEWVIIFEKIFEKFSSIEEIDAAIAQVTQERDAFVVDKNDIIAKLEELKLL